MKDTNEFKKKYNMSFEEFKEIVDNSNSIKEVSRKTRLSVYYINSILSEYGLCVVPKCKMCKKELPLNDKGNIHKFCSDRCSYLYKTSMKTCKSCGKEFLGQRGVLYCSEECKSKAYKNKYIECKWCGNKFKGHSLSEYCCTSCKNKASYYNIDNIEKVCKVCGKKYIGYSACSIKCLDILIQREAKTILGGNIDERKESN